MRADKVEGSTVTFGQTEGSAPASGTKIYRSYNHSLEKALENNPPTRLIPAEIRLTQTDGGRYLLTAGAAGAASASVEFTAEPALNRDKAAAGLRSSLSRRSGIFSFALTELPEDGPLPFLPSSAANALRREMAAGLEPAPAAPDMRESIPFDRLDRNRIIPPAQRTQLNCANSLSRSIYESAGIEPGSAFETAPAASVELMRCKYCIRHEMGRCPKQRPGEKAAPFYLENNGRRIKAVFDCARCEMVILPDGGNAPVPE